MFFLFLDQFEEDLRVIAEQIVKYTVTVNTHILYLYFLILTFPLFHLFAQLH